MTGKRILGLLVCAALLPATVWARQPGPALEAVAERVVDGDTIRVRLVGEMPELFRRQGVRLRHCDTPEKRDRRPEIAALARQASAYTATRVAPGARLTLLDVGRDKYGGRLLADIEVEGENLCAALIEAGLAVPYEGGKKGW